LLQVEDMADTDSLTRGANGIEAAQTGDEVEKSEIHITAVSVDPHQDEATNKDPASVGITELLDIDDRPIFILDLACPEKTIPVYHNASLQELQAQVLGLKIWNTIRETIAEAASDPKHILFLD
jgi:hypothetical protein